MDTSRYMELIKNRLRSRPLKQIEDTGPYRHAGVLIPLFWEGDTIKVLFTKRTERVAHHKGQISFPGGAVDRDDPDFVHTALRETEEEIGVKRDEVAVLGQIDDEFARASGFIVHPFVGMIPYPYPFRVSTEEVDRILKVPLGIFKPENRKTVRYELDSGDVVPEPAYEYQGEIIWGATGRIMENFIKSIGVSLD